MNKSLQEKEVLQRENVLTEHDPQMDKWQDSQNHTIAWRPYVENEIDLRSKAVEMTILYFKDKDNVTPETLDRYLNTIYNFLTKTELING